VFNAGAIVPAPIEQDDLASRGQFPHIALEVPLPALLLVWRSKGDDTADPRVERIGNTLNDPAGGFASHTPAS
jgi:hypothetical protein